MNGVHRPKLDELPKSALAPPPHVPTFLPIERCPPYGAAVDYAVLDESGYGLWEHYSAEEARSIMCSEKQCGIECKICTSGGGKPRWTLYVSAVNMRSKRVVLVCVPLAAFNNCKELNELSKFGRLRGEVLQLRRKGKSKRGPVFAKMTGPIDLASIGRKGYSTNTARLVVEMTLP